MHYQLLETDAIEQDAGSQIKLYGIKYQSPTDKLTYEFDQLTPQKSLVEELIALCVEGEVTEVTLKDIVEDFIALL